jgi:16S rRNA (cytosine967-C5)-methyltransferase
VAFPSGERDPAARLVSWGSHPRWLADRWIARWGVQQASALVDANNLRPELYIRPLGIGAAAAVERLAAADIEALPVAGAPDALRLTAAGDLAAAFGVVPAIVQDPAATLVVRYASPEPGARIADVAAAPGGKALALAAPSDHTSPRFVVAADVSVARVARLHENAARIGGLPMAIVVADLRAAPLRAAAFDLVLLDAPCTGTGTLRRHPDGRWRIGAHDLAALVVLQRDLLDAAAALVRPGGILLYATCSLEAEENELQVQAFLSTRPDFALTPPPTSTVDDRFLDAGMLFVMPQVSGFDGAFAARMRRS